MRNNRAKSRAARQGGLTLIELLVAISILAIIAVLGWRGLDSIVRARAALTSDLEQTRGMQLTFAQMQSDCAHIASPSTIGARLPIMVNQGRFTLVRTVFAENQPSRLQIVSYLLKDGVLSRLESVATRDMRVLDTLWLSAASNLAVSDSGKIQPVALLSGVSMLTMRTWVNGSWRAGTDPATQAAGSTTSSPDNFLVPTGLEVTLQLHGHESSLLKIFMLGAI
jgi:general secretion pathway protein J